MIEFKGCITGNAAKYFWKASKSILRNVFLWVIFILFPVALIITMMTVDFKIMVAYALLSASMLIMLEIPRGEKDKESWLPKRIFADEEYIVCKSEKYEEYKLIEDASRLIDYGDFYYIVFPFGKISDKFICQKGLLTQGTLEEFESLFEGKIERKFDSPKDSK